MNCETIIDETHPFLVPESDLLHGASKKSVGTLQAKITYGTS
jgi:hypothetical protein